MVKNTNQPINLLWTGGWDSTFRLLQILLIENKSVKPFYVIDHKRKSLDMELKAMSAIKLMLLNDYPFTRDLIYPTIYFNISDIMYNKAFTDIRPKVIGSYAKRSQDLWFIYLANYLGITDFEFCMEKQSYTEGEFRPLILTDSIGNGHDCRLRDNLKDKDLIGYKCMRFPLLDLTKSDMKQIAADTGFLYILEKTWFCHFPKFGYPCGICFPCQLVMLNKLNDRMPLLSRIRYHLMRAMKKIVIF